LLKDDVYVRRIPLENDSFAVIPSLGPLVPGHSLLCPKAHLKSMAGIPVSQFPEYRQLKRRLTSILQSVYQAPIHLFEHGCSEANGRVLCSTDHAHLHFVPVNADVWTVLHEELAWTEIGTGGRGLSSYVKGSEYLYYESPDSRSYIAVPLSKGFPSQYMRRAFARASGNRGHWNWKETPSPTSAVATYESIRECDRACIA